MMTFSIGKNEHRTFIEISGDSNPLHADPGYCAKTPYETPVIHGVHLVFLCLAYIEKEFSKKIKIKKLIEDAQLSCVFTNTVTIDEKFNIDILDNNSDGLIAQVTGKRCRQVKAKLKITKIKLNDYNIDHAKKYHLEKLETLQQRLANRGNKFLDKYTWFGAANINNLLNLTRIVGMVAPGESALFRSFEMRLDFSETEVKLQKVFEDKRFGLVRYEIEGFGKYDALVRPQLVDHQNLQPVEIDAGFFNQEYVIAVFGVTRGLGFLVALSLLAAGYQVVGFGRRPETPNLERLREYKNFRFQIFDAESDEQPKMRALNRFYAVFYFCTPSTRLGSKNFYDKTLYSRYLKYYVSIPREICGRLKPAIFMQPSSVAIETRPPQMIEYADAKLQQEKWMSERRQGTVLYCPRLPAVATDQNTVPGVYNKLSLSSAVSLLMESLKNE